MVGLPDQYDTPYCTEVSTEEPNGAGTGTLAHCSGLVTPQPEQSVAVHTAASL